MGIVETNCEPDEVDYVIPGNDDAIRACSLITKVMADAIQEGQYVAYQGMQTRATREPEFEPESSPAAAEPVEEGARRPIQLSEDEAAFLGAAIEGEREAEAIAAEEPGQPAEAAAEEA